MSTKSKSHGKNELDEEYTELGRFDDVLTVLLLDQLNLWFKTRKFHPNHLLVKKPHINFILNIHSLIFTLVVLKGKLLDATNLIINLLSQKKLVLNNPYISTKSTKEHIARYLSIYHPEAGFEITDTHQYEQYKTSDNINKNYGQARVLATKKFKTESIITHLMGLFSPIDEELLDKLKSKGLDFSVMISSRTNKNCLLLGPARFVNHDCNPNAKFHFLAPHIITFKVIRNIQFGEEITVSYGDNYFGENNKECLCSTCKSNKILKENKDSPIKRKGYTMRRLKVFNNEEISIDINLLPKASSNIPYFEQSNNKANKVKLSPVTEISDDDSSCTWCYNPCETEIITINNKPRIFLNGIEGTFMEGLDELIHPVDEPTTCCLRCSRHYEIFGLPWPHRKYPKKILPDLKAINFDLKLTNNNKPTIVTPVSKKVSKILPPTPSPTHSTPESSLSIKKEINLSDIPKELYEINEEYNERDLVFIDPWDKDASCFWPAIVVPIKEIDRNTMIPIKDKEKYLVVRRLDTTSYQVVDKRGVYKFDPFGATFQSFLKQDPSFIERSGIRASLCYYKTNCPPPNFMWRKWQTKFAAGQWDHDSKDNLGIKKTKSVLSYFEELEIISRREEELKETTTKYHLREDETANAIFPKEGFSEHVVKVKEVIFWNDTLGSDAKKGVLPGLNYYVELIGTDTHRYIQPEQVLSLNAENNKRKNNLEENTATKKRTKLPQRGFIKERLRSSTKLNKN